MAEFYVKPTQAAAQAGVDAINNNSVFSIVGKVNGVIAPNNQQTTAWCGPPRELTTGEWAWPRVPTSLLDAVGIPESERTMYVTAYGSDIRDLDPTDFVDFDDD